MGELLTVGGVVQRTGVTRKALRLYEEQALVEPAGRTDAGYRLYDEEALRRLELLRRAKLLGLTLAEAKEFLHVADGCCGDNHPELAGLAQRKLAQTEQRIEELRGLRDTLRTVLDRLATEAGRHRCEETLCTCGAPLRIKTKGQ